VSSPALLTATSALPTKSHISTLQKHVPVQTIQSLDKTKPPSRLHVAVVFVLSLFFTFPHVHLHCTARDDTLHSDSEGFHMFDLCFALMGLFLLFSAFKWFFYYKEMVLGCLALIFSFACYVPLIMQYLKK
jgi:hypothetical protein